MADFWVIGDSTVEDNQPPFRGWGWALARHVRENVRVHNLALSGRSSLSFRREGLFAPAEEGMRAGDVLLIQFGHNDEKTDERHTDPDSTFREELMGYCDAAVSRGAHPVLLTPVSRRFFEPDGTLRDTHGPYPGAVRALAGEKGIFLCDLYSLSRSLFEGLGAEKTAELFVRLGPGEHPDYPQGHDDRTHFNAYGAETVCRLVVRALRADPVCAGLLRDEDE